jgi:DNA primase
VSKEWFLNHAALGRHDTLFVVEGENDVASFLDAGINNVIGTAGQPSKDQFRLLKNNCSGQTLYLWFDQDKQKDFRKETGGPAHIRKICAAIAADDNITIKIITHPPGLKEEWRAGQGS